MADLVFSSLNPYESLQAIVADDPQALVGALTEIRTPIKVVAICPFGNKQVAYIMGDIRITKKRKVKDNGNSNSSGS